MKSQGITKVITIHWRGNVYILAMPEAGCIVWIAWLYLTGLCEKHFLPAGGFKGKSHEITKVIRMHHLSTIDLDLYQMSWQFYPVVFPIFQKSKTSTC